MGKRNKVVMTGSAFRRNHFEQSLDQRKQAFEIPIRRGLTYLRCESINPREGMIVNKFRNALIAPRFADAFTASRTTATQF